MARKIEVPIVANASKYVRELRKAQGATSKFGAVAKAALVTGVAAGLYELGKAAKIGFEEYNEGAKVAAQTNAVIKSTGGVANVTAQHVHDLADALHLKTTFDDEAIQSGENMLLTFRGIRNEVGKGNDIFDRATKLSLDFAQAMGMDNTDAALQLGKALNNPITGMTRLQRQGVTFTDKQKALITRLEETGHHLQAQKVILKELTKEFGGSAEAAGKTFGGQLIILRNRLDDFLGMVTEKAIPYLKRLFKWIGPYMSQAADIAREAIKSLRKHWAQFNDLLERHQETIRQVRKLLHGLATVLGFLIRWNLLLYSTIFKVWMKIAEVVLTATDKVIGFVRSMAHKVRGWFNTAADAVHPFISAIQTVYNWILAVISAVGRLVSAISQIHFPSLPGGGGLLSRIPGLAAGGIVKRPTLAMVGESGPEAVVPLSRAGRNGGGMGGEVRVIVVGGDAQAIRYFNDLFGRYGKRNG